MCVVRSQISGSDDAGEGLFAKRGVLSGSLVALFNGTRYRGYTFVLWKCMCAIFVPQDPAHLPRRPLHCLFGHLVGLLDHAHQGDQPGHTAEDARPRKVKVA